MKPLPIAAAALGAFWLARTIVARRTRYDLAGRTVVVVGGGRGLGLQIAREAAKRGAKLGLVSRSQAELTTAHDELAADGTPVVTAVADVRDAAAIGAAFATIERALGAIDVLINDAGVIEVGPVDALRFDDYAEAIDINYLGSVRTVEAVRPAMQARGEGRIVNIASIGGKVVVPHLLPYCASKFALVAYSEGLRAELAQYGIVVTTVVPGLMRTGSPPHAKFAGRTEKEYALFAGTDALPLLSVSASSAARRIVDACERGEIEAAVGWQARLAAVAYALAPRTVIRLCSGLARVLPDGGEAPEHRDGRSSESAVSQSPVFALGHRATVEHNEDVDPATR